MDDLHVKTNSFKAWLLAARPKTLAGAAVPVAMGCTLAWTDCGTALHIIPALICFLFAFVMQIDANFVNDYFDFIKGNDDETRLGPKRACAQGWITVKAMQKGIAATTLVACATGLPLVVYGGWEMVGVGVLCVAFCFLYTTHLSYKGLGDVLVLVFFGLVPVTLTYYLCMPPGRQAVTAEVIGMAVACGLVIDTLLVVNNFRDMDNDSRAGKRTLAVRLGHANTGWLYYGLGCCACMIGVALFWKSHPLAAFLPIFYWMKHISTYRQMIAIGKGERLNLILEQTARNISIYGICVVLGLLL